MPVCKVPDTSIWSRVNEIMLFVQHVQARLAFSDCLTLRYIFVQNISEFTHLDIQISENYNYFFNHHDIEHKDVLVCINNSW